MYITRHAESRCSQRGIPREAVSILAKYGEVGHAPGDATKLSIPRRYKSSLVSELKRLIQSIERASDAEIIIAEDGAVLTAYRRS